MVFHQTINKFLDHPDFEELRKYRLGQADWEALEAFKKILEV
jgi:hypothetical protein